MTESESSKSKARTLGWLALLCLLVAIGLLASAALPFVVTGGTEPVNWNFVEWSGVAASAAGVSFFFSQLFHIRAAVEKPANRRD